MSPRRTVTVAFIVILALSSGATVPVADARHPPTPVCGVCSLNQTAPDGTNIVAGDSTLTISIHENGSTTWRANVTLTDGSDTLAENASLRETVVDDVTGWDIAHPTDTQTRIDNDSLIVTYRDPTAVESRVGAIAFTPLTPEGPGLPFVMGGEGARYLGTDQLTLRAPPGYELRGDAQTTEKGQSLVWARGSERTYLDVRKDPVAVKENVVMPGYRVWLARFGN